MGEYHQFLRTREEYYRSISSPVRSKNSFIVNALKIDGIVKIARFINPENLAKIRKALDDHTNWLSSRFTTHPHSFAQYWATRSNGCIANDNKFSCFFEDPFLEEVTLGYVSRDCYSFDWGFSLKNNVNETTQSDIYHFDDWKHRFKIILLLNDMDMDNAPTIFLKGSHKYYGWRLIPEYLYWKHRQEEKGGKVYWKDDADGRVIEAEDCRFIRQYGFEELPIVGNAGDVFFADFRCLHKATPLRKGYRLLAIKWYTAGK